MLREWDGTMSSGPDPGVSDYSVLCGYSALLFTLVSDVIAMLILRGQYDVRMGNIMDGEDLAAYDHYRRNAKPGFFEALASGSSDDGWRGEDIDRIATIALIKAILKTEEFESRGWPLDWEKLHSSGRSHALLGRFPESTETLDVRAIPVAGDEDVPFATAAAPFGPIGAISGPVNRYLHNPGNWSKGKWVVPLGTSGNPGSEHLTDQQQMWANVEYIPQLYEWDEIRANSESMQEFLPAS